MLHCTARLSTTAAGKHGRCLSHGPFGSHLPAHTRCAACLSLFAGQAARNAVRIENGGLDEKGQP